MAKQFQVRKPIASVEQGKEKLKEAAQVRDDDWLEAFTATITSENIDTWKNLAIEGYSAAGAPADWLALYQVGMKLVTVDALTAGASIGKDIWKAKMSSDHVANKWGLQYKGNKYILEATRNQIVALGFDSEQYYATRAVFQVVCMQYGRKYLELKLRELFGLESPSYTEVDQEFANALVTEAEVPTDKTAAVVTAIKQAAFSGANAIYQEISG